MTQIRCLQLALIGTFVVTMCIPLCQPITAVGAGAKVEPGPRAPIYAVTRFTFRRGPVDDAIGAEYGWNLKEAIRKELHNRAEFVTKRWDVFWANHHDGHYDVIHVEVEEGRNPRFKTFYMHIHGGPKCRDLDERHPDYTCNGEEEFDCRRDAATALAKRVGDHDKASHTRRAHSP